MQYEIVDLVFDAPDILFDTREHDKAALLDMLGIKDDPLFSWEAAAAEEMYDGLVKNGIDDDDARNAAEWLGLEIFTPLYIPSF